ncbi:MAG: CHAP domain-containing protein [Actinobacteria bacterium]|nr:MAG: CHAP domain-containing protein [Actinomycetota bacterium]TML18780.1 MAG: CHAP domain-containing protein [Actinomycetota bacterium]
MPAPPSALVLVLVVGSAAFALGLGGSDAPLVPGSAAGRVVVDGYPYASRCPGAGYADVVDTWGMYVCNCTSYVAWALRANGQRTDWFIRGAMDAWNWPHVARLARLSLGTVPHARAVAVWPKIGRPFGHVAYVTGVEPNGRFDVGEYNLPSTSATTPYTFDIRKDIRPAGAVFIYVPSRAPRTRH